MIAMLNDMFVQEACQDLKADGFVVESETSMKIPGDLQLDIILFAHPVTGVVIKFEKIGQFIEDSYSSTLTINFLGFWKPFTQQITDENESIISRLSTLTGESLSVCRGGYSIKKQWINKNPDKMLVLLATMYSIGSFSKN